MDGVKGTRRSVVGFRLSMGGTRIFELGGQRGSKAESMGGRRNCCYRTFNRGKLAAGALAVNHQKLKEIQHWLCNVLTHFVDFYIKFTLRQWTGRVERTRIIFSHDDRGTSGAGHNTQGQLSRHPAGAAHEVEITTTYTAVLLHIYIPCSSQLLNRLRLV